MEPQQPEQVDPAAQPASEAGRPTLIQGVRVSLTLMKALSHTSSILLMTASGLTTSVFVLSVLLLFQLFQGREPDMNAGLLLLVGCVVSYYAHIAAMISLEAWLNTAYRHLFALGVRDLMAEPYLLGLRISPRFRLAAFRPWPLLMELWKASDPAARGDDGASRKAMPGWPAITFWLAGWPQLAAFLFLADILITAGDLRLLTVGLVCLAYASAIAMVNDLLGVFIVERISQRLVLRVSLLREPGPLGANQQTS